MKTKKKKMNKFTNDGSFMEQFRKRMEEQKNITKDDKNRQLTDASVGLGHCIHKHEADDKADSSQISRTTVTTDPGTDTVPGPSLNTRSGDYCYMYKDTSDDTREFNVKTNSCTDENAKSLPVKKKTSVLSFVGKRPGSKLTLKTGQVKKKRQQEEESESADAWSKYMAEVKKFRKGLDEDGNSRPLIK